MSRKRRASEEKNDDDGESVDAVDEEIQGDDSDDEEDEMDEEAEVDNGHSGNLPFLDSFYGLASSSPAERAQSAHAMLNHCLLGPSANSNDAAYAFRRLMNGLCSGRAAARQGYASTLTSFLKIAQQTGALKKLQEEGSDSTVLGFLRNQLVKATDPSETAGKKKGSEERDHHFGRLFGILSVIRSGILLPKDNQDDLDDKKEVSLSFAKDLVALYNHRKWMREPTAFAIINLLDSYYDLCPRPEAVDIVNDIVSEVVVPELLSDVEVSEYTAEQIAIAVNIQSQALDHGMSLPARLSTVVLSKSTVPLMAKALSATSTVSQPRMHAVWDVIWCLYLSVPKDPEARPLKGKPVTRILRKKLPGCSDSAQDIVEALVEYVVSESLLGVDADSGVSAGTNATHERRALAMALIKVLSGSDSMSNKTGPFRLIVDGSLLETVILTPVVVRKVFIDVICAGGGKQSSHFLKPMAQRVLDSIVVGGELSSDDMSRRLSCAKAFLACEPRFDGRTKSGACVNLLLLDDQVIDEVTPELVQVWKAYVDFLQDRVLAATQTSANGEHSASYEALGYIDLLFVAAKRFTRLMAGDDGGVLKVNLSGQILAFFFVGAFFDCSSLKKGGNDMIYNAAKLIQKSASSVFTYDVRITMSARFYSLLADSAVVAIPSKSLPLEAAGKQNKDLRLFQLLGEFTQGWTKLEEKGCKRLGKASRQSSDPDMIPDKTIFEIVSKQQKAAGAEAKDANDLRRFRIGCASLNSALYLHLLSCGDPESVDGEDDMDLDEDENNESAIKEFISDLATAQHNLMCDLGLVQKTDDDEIENALGEIAEVCVGVLSSSFGANSQTRGASPKLLKETVRAAWTGALLLCGHEKPEPSPLDKGLLDLLLGSIGAKQEDDDEEEEEQEESDEDEQDAAMDSEEEEDDDAVFAEATAAGIDVEGDEDDPEDGDTDNDDEVVLDSSQLQNFLLEESDDDDDVLEHHAGADKALAKLIKLKQEARKAGQQALERVELSNQLRCTLLMEIVLSNPGRHFDVLYTPEFVQGMILKILAQRRQLEKSLLSGIKAGKKASVADSEKRALVEKLTVIMKTKLFKMKTFPQISAPEFNKLLTGIMDETRKAETEVQFSCCSAALVSLCKMTASDDTLASLTAGYTELVNEWATKRTTRLKTIVFSDLVQQQTSMAQILLSSSLCSASKMQGHLSLRRSL
ncbi:DNA polymerase phi [Fragilaria crotonensis]|nr:DNA polymerase phi [Fragilaria crotonensis]